MIEVLQFSCTSIRRHNDNNDNSNNNDNNYNIGHVKND